MKNSVLADTGFWLALLNKNDRHHGAAASYLRQYRSTLVTTWPVVTEVCHLVCRRIGQSQQQRFIHALDSGWILLYEINKTHLARIHSLMDKYADLPMDLADASLVLLAEEVGHGNILSTDQRDFKTYRWKKRHPFKNLLLPE